LGQLGENPAGGSGGGRSGTRKLVAPRPGHADLAGSQKFNYHDARYILERASAREPRARGGGRFCKTALRKFDTEIASHTIQIATCAWKNPPRGRKFKP